MQTKKFVFAFSLLITMSLVLTAQQSEQRRKKIAPALLRQDLLSLKNTLESSQPGLYVYQSKDSLDAIFKNLEASIIDSLTSLEFFRRIAPLNGYIRNLHTRLWPSTNDQNAMAVKVRFPFDIYWDRGKMFVLRNHSSNTKILPGSVISSINDEPVEEIFRMIVEARARDGFNETYPTAQASRNFSYYYADLMGTPDKFLVEMIFPSGEREIFSVSGVSAEEIEKSRSQHQRKYSQHAEDWDAWIAEKKPALQLEIKNDVAIMRLKTFYIPSIEDNGQDYNQFFQKSFKEISRQNPKGLVIDLRNNHGGSDLVGMALMSYLHDSVFYYYKKRSAFLKPNMKAVKNGDVYEIEGRGVWSGKVIPVKEIFTEKVCVLMNGYSVSAAAEFIGHLKNIQRATFVGEEAGGNPVVFAGGENLSIDLANSRVTGTIPLHLIEMNVRLKNNGHGVIPDYEIKPTIDDILLGRDVEMEFAIRNILGN